METIKPNRKSPTYCPRAFHGFNQQLDHVCCMIKPDTRYKNYTDLQQSQYLQDVQVSMNAGEKPSACNHCWKTEDLGLGSHRTKANQSLSDNVNDNSLVYLTLFTGNICNFACRTCSSMLTFQRRKEELWLNETFGTQFNPVPKTYADYSQLESADLSHVRTISVLGGEPFLDPKHFDVIKKVADTSGNVDIHYSTNGSIDVTEFYDRHLSSFANVTISFSIDAIGRDFEYIRTNGKWNQVHSNIQAAIALQNKVNNFHTHFHSTISAISLTGLSALSNYADVNNLQIVSQIVRNPEYYGFAALSDNVRQYILDTHDLGQFDYVIRNAFDQVEHNPTATTELVAYINRTTEFRKMDINDYIPEFKPIYEMLSNV